MTAKYGATYIIKPDIDDEAEKAVVDKYDKAIADNSAAMVESRDWGKHRFAYEINKYREGAYHIMTFTAEGAKAVDEPDRLSRINNQVLRSMAIRLDK